jgi:hypothetical protein
LAHAVLPVPPKQYRPHFLRIEHSFETADFPTARLNFPLSISKWHPFHWFQDEQVRTTPPASMHNDAVCVIFKLRDRSVVLDDDV